MEATNLTLKLARNSSHNLNHPSRDFYPGKTTLTGQTILLPTDDVAAYEKLGEELIVQHRPAAYLEEMLVQSIIDAEWRLLRIPGLESAIYAVDHTELIGQFPAEQIELKVFLKYQRELKNLNLQGTRLRRMRQKDLAELKKLQTERQEKEEETKKNSQQPTPTQPSLPPPLPFSPKPNKPPPPILGTTFPNWLQIFERGRRLALRSEKFRQSVCHSL